VEIPFGANANLWWSIDIEVMPSRSILKVYCESLSKAATKPPKHPSI